jgi:hypothetical protein
MWQQLRRDLCVGRPSSPACSLGSLDHANARGSPSRWNEKADIAILLWLQLLGKQNVGVDERSRCRIKMVNKCFKNITHLD